LDHQSVNVTSESATAEKTQLWRRQGFRRILYGFAAIQVVAFYGVVGYLAMGWTFLDAIFQVVITISGVGFTEVQPLTSVMLRIHTMTLITLGILSVAFTLGSFVQFLTEAEFLNYFGRQRMMKQIELLTGHTIVAGYGRVGALVCDELATHALPFVVVELTHERAAMAEARGFAYVAGDATEEKVLSEAGIERAKVLVSVMPDDAENVFITLTARQMCPQLMIIARAEGPSTPKKLRQAGADHIVMPTVIGANRIVSLLTNPAAVEFAELVTKNMSLAIEMDDVPIVKTSPLAGRSLRDADIKRRTGVIVIAIKRADGQLEFPPSGDEIVAAGDSVVLLGRRPHLDQFREQYLGI
jgi:voltage-gated potassium channel